MTPSPRPRVVLDTNVVVAAAFNPTSASAMVLAAIRAGTLTLIWSDGTREETEHIVNKIPPIRWSTMSELYTGEGRFDGGLDVGAWEHVPDPDDRKFAALAAAADATLLTMDDHLLSGRAAADVQVLTPGEFLERHPEIA